MRISLSPIVFTMASLLVASMLIRCVVAAYQPHSPEVASARTLVVASSAQSRTLAPAVEAGRSTYSEADR